MAIFSLDASNYDELGYVKVSFSAQSQETVNHYAWRIYRRVGTEPWELLYQDVTSPTEIIFYDYLALPNVEQDWSVVEVTSTDGGQTLVEEAHSPTSATPQGFHYWLIHPDDESLSLRLSRVTEDSFTEDFEEEELLLIGRGRKVDRGTAWGISGTLAVSLRGTPDGSMSGRDQRQALSALRASPSPLWLRDPFGDLTKVALFGSTSYEREAGVGPREFVSVEVLYKEVA